MPVHRIPAALLLCLALPVSAFDVSRVSLDEQGDQIPGSSSDASLTVDGRVMAFTTDAGLVPEDTNGFEDVYLRDLVSGNILLVSESFTAAPPDRPSRRPVISGDGNRVVFVSSASNLVRGDTGGNADVFLYDRVEDSLTRITRGFDGSEADGSSGKPRISWDGKVVAFESRASNLVEDDTNGVQDVFIHGLVSGVTRRVSVTSDGGQLSERSGAPSLSADGLKVAFSSLAPQINPRARSGLSEVFTHHLVTGETARVRLPPALSEPSDVFGDPHLSPDGRWLAFTRTRDGGGGLSDVMLQELDTRETIRVTEPIGQPRRASHSIGGIAYRGSFVVFDSIADNLVPGDDNGQKDVFHYDRVNDELTRVSGPGPNAGGNGESRALGVSPIGGNVLFASRANNLVPDDTNGTDDIFINDLSMFFINSRVSGSWYDESQDGHGFSLEYLSEGRKLVFYWFTFTPEGDREWIFGLLDVDDTVAEGEAFRHLGDGARFPPDFDASAIEQERWGTIRFEFTACDSGTVSWDAEPPYGPGSMDLTRLTPAPGCE